MRALASISAVFFSCFAVCLVVAAKSEQVPPDEAPREQPPILAMAPDSNFFGIGDNIIIGRPDFTGNPRWVLYETKAENLDGDGDRAKAHWHSSSTAIPERHIGDPDYAHSGFARGHLSPAADNKANQTIMNACHDYANCVPQNQAMNAGVWERIEARRRDWARAGKRVYSIAMPIYFLKDEDAETGFVWKRQLRAHGPHFVWEPAALAVSIRVEDRKGIVLHNYLVPNTAAVASRDMDEFKVTCDDLEELVNINLWGPLSEAYEKVK